MPPPVNPEEALHNFVRRNFQEVSKAHPAQPREGRSLKWTLFQILEQVKALNTQIAGIAQNQSIKR